VAVPLRDFGIPQEFLDHATRAQILEQIGLTAPAIAERVAGVIAKQDSLGQDAADTMR